MLPPLLKRPPASAKEYQIGRLKVAVCWKELRDVEHVDMLRRNADEVTGHELGSLRHGGCAHKITVS